MSSPIGTNSKVLDSRDLATVTERVNFRAQRTTPLVGDFIRYADGVTRRISYIWPEGVQSAGDGSFYLQSSGDMSFSGKLFTATPTANLTDTGTVEPGLAMVFSHDMPGKDRGVEFLAPCRVWSTTDAAPEV